MVVTSRADFATFTLVPKLIRWGIDAYRGILFGIPNQIVMGLVAIGPMVSIAYGYAMWWTRRPAVASVALIMAWLRLSFPARALWAIIAVAFGWSLAALGISLAAFILIDIIRSAASRQPA